MAHKDLKRAGLKATAPRLLILQLLAETQAHHLSAEALYKMLLDANEDVGLATVYRVLTQFEAAGLVRRHNFEGGKCVYELDNGEHHDHMVCVECNHVAEFVDHGIEQRQRSIAQQAGFTITDHTLTIYGLCAQCSSNTI